MRNVAFCLAVLLSGCVTSQETYLPDGSLGHNISCSGSELTWGSCLQKAGDLCGQKGYEMYTIGENGLQYVSIPQASLANTTSNRTMIVKCK